MLTRRTMIAGLGALTCLPALAQSDWRQSIKEIRFGVSSAEHEAGAIARNQPVIDYLTGKLGVPVKLYRVSDYAGLVGALRADQLEFARFGPAVDSLGRRVLGDKLQPLFRDIDNNGQEGYYSVIVVRADSPYKSRPCANALLGCLRCAPRRLRVKLDESRGDPFRSASPE